MKIPNGDRAIIDKSKLTDYALNINHDRGGPKAKKLIRYGYSPDNWQQLELDIRKYHLTADIRIEKATRYGTRYEIRAALLAPINKPLYVRTIWQIDNGTDLPRLITLVPTSK